MSATRSSVVWLSASGQTAMRYIDTADATGEGVVAALAAHSQAAVYQEWEGELFTHPHPAPAGGQYSLTSQVAALYFAAGDSSVVVYLPAPSADIFKADGVTVDATKISDIIDAVVGHVVAASGALVTAFTTGRLQQKGAV